MTLGALHINIRAKGIVSGQSTFMLLEYAGENPIVGLGSQTVCQAWVDKCWDSWKALVHSDFTLLEVEADIFQSSPGAYSPTYTLAINESGGVVSGQSLPPQATIVIVKQPDNANRYPASAPAFRSGRSSFSGIPESQQNGGLVESSVVDEWNDLGELIEKLDFDFDSVSYQIPLVMYRRREIVGGYANERVPVIETYVSQKIGSQNTRKR